MPSNTIKSASHGASHGASHKAATRAAKKAESQKQLGLALEYMGGRLSDGMSELETMLQQQNARLRALVNQEASQS